jgi:hypothetical protein
MDFSQYTDQQLVEAIAFYRRQRNTAMGLNEAAHSRAKSIIRLAEQEQARRLEEKKLTAKDVKQALASAKAKPKETVSLKKPPFKMEEVEELDELSKKTLGSYIKKASDNAITAVDDAHIKGTNKGTAYGQAIKRSKGIAKATDRLTKEEVDLEESRKLLAARKSAERAADQKVRVDKKTYDWGKMVTVHDGIRKSFPLHPEHQEKIKNLKHGESTTFTDETRNKVKAHREGDTVHLQRADSDKKTSVPYSHFAEEVDLDELSTGTLKSYRTAAWKDAGKAYKTSDSSRKSDAERNAAFKRGDKRMAGYELATAKTGLKPNKTYQDSGVGSIPNAKIKSTKEEVELDEVSASKLGSYIRKSSKDADASMKKRNDALDNDDGETARKMGRLARKRDKGADMAMDKLKGTRYAKVHATESVELDEAADLRVTKVYNKWPKKATYAVHNADRSYHKEFDSMEAAKAHHAEKSGK